jgi:hypothetical protein
MKKLKVGRPSTGAAGLVVGCVALIVALSGSAVGLPGINRVDSGDIKNNSVKGKDVAEPTLGTVPDANELGGQPASNFATAAQLAALAPDDQILSLAGAMDVGDPPLTLDVWGPFTFIGTCGQNMGVERGAIDIATSQDNTFLNAQAQDDADFDVADSPNILAEHVGNVSNSSANPPDIDFWDAGGGFTFISTSDGAPDDGIGIGIALNTAGAECRFSGGAFGPDL